MLIPKVRRVIVVIAVVATITGCGFTGLGEVVPGGRRWLIPVDNRSQHPVSLMVAEDAGFAGTKVGRATPDSVPAGKVVIVAFDVPPGSGWGIFVDPTRNASALIAAGDVPADEAGDLPIRIEVSEAGELHVSSPRQPGWWGN